jgi:hypothetical protein
MHGETMSWLSVDLSEVQPPSESWRLTGAYLDKEGGGPLVLLRFDAKSGPGRTFARMDRGKNMAVDPLPGGITIPAGDFARISEEILGRVRAHDYTVVAAEEIRAA